MSNSEDFPNEVAQDMLSMVSPIYESSYVAQWIFHVMGKGIGKAQTLIHELPNEVFPETATWTLPYWEEIYGLEKREFLAVEERRKCILEKRNTYYPMNPARMAELLENRYGRGFEIIEKEGTYTFLIKTVQGGNGIDFTKLFDYVNGIKMSHMSYAVMIEMDEKFKATAGFAIKEHKRIGITGYIPEDPLIGVKCYYDENMILLADENDNLLID